MWCGGFLGFLAILVLTLLDYAKGISRQRGFPSVTFSLTRPRPIVRYPSRFSSLIKHGLVAALGNVAAEDSFSATKSSFGSDLSSTDAAEGLEDVCLSVYQGAMMKINNLHETLDSGDIVDALGTKSDEILAEAKEKFLGANLTPSDICEKRQNETLRLIEANLHVLFIKQLGRLQSKTLDEFRSVTKDGNPPSEKELMTELSQKFSAQAAESRGSQFSWNYNPSVKHVKKMLGECLHQHRKLLEGRLLNANHQKGVLDLLNKQQHQIKSLQQQLAQSQQGSPLNLGVAYRIPDTNVNLSGTYQQGKTAVQVSCVPDSSAPLLSSNGFVHGVGSGNMGLSVNLSV